jgi:hypothetical protein
MAETTAVGTMLIVHRSGGPRINIASIVLAITRPLLFGRQRRTACLRGWSQHQRRMVLLVVYRRLVSNGYDVNEGPGKFVGLAPMVKQPIL